MIALRLKSLDEGERCVKHPSTDYLPRLKRSSMITTLNKATKILHRSTDLTEWHRVAHTRISTEVQKATRLTIARPMRRSTIRMVPTSLTLKMKRTMKRRHYLTSRSIQILTSTLACMVWSGLDSSRGLTSNHIPHMECGSRSHRSTNRSLRTPTKTPATTRTPQSTGTRGSLPASMVVPKRLPSLRYRTCSQKMVR